MENNKLICTQCGKEMKSTDKFCTSCGQKNESYVEQETQEVFKTLEVNDIKIVENKDLIEQKPKKNKKLMIGGGIAIAIILVVALIAPTVYALFSPTTYVKNAITNTFEELEKSNKKFNEVPSLTSLFADNEGNNEKELYLKIDELSSDSFGMYIDTSMFEDYGIKLKLQSNKDNTAGNLNLALQYGEDEVVGGRVYYDNKLLALEAPKLFNDILGVKIEENKENSNEDLTEFNSTMNMLSEVISSSKNIEKIYIELALKYGNQLADLAKFEKNKSDKSLYTATIKGDDFVDIITSFMTELFNNEEFKEYLVASLYMQDSYNSREYYVDMVDNMALSLSNEIDYMLEEVEIGDLVVDVRTKDKKMESIEASLNITSYDETLKLKYTMNYINEKDNYGLDFSFKFGIDSYDSIDGSIMYSNEGKDLSRKTSVDVNVSEMDGTMSFDFEEVLKDKNMYENSLTCNINDYYSDIMIKLDTEGSYKNKERIDYNDIELTISVDGEPIKLNLSGYASNVKIKSIESIDSNKVVYIEELDEQDFNELYEELMKNLYLIMNSFGSMI